jgi:hypothetical protein
MSTNDTHHGESPHDCRLSRFERNRFFHGKLMTARDMFAEQAYHADRLDTFAQHLAGEGILEGLDLSVVEKGTGDLSVTVSPGVALDCCGRLLVVEDDGSDHTVEASAIFDDGGDPTVRLYLEYDECVKETVPLAGSASGCEEQCEYNRVLEIVQVVGRETLPEEYKEIPQIDFPDETAATADAQSAMVGIAESFHEHGGTLRECTAERRSVFAGTFRESLGTDNEWGRDEADKLGYAYTPDLLFAAVGRHAIRFDNPHDVTAVHTGALRSVNEMSNPGPEGSGNVNVVSPDASITVGTIPGDPAAGTDPEVTLAVAAAAAEENEHLTRYVLDKSLKYTREVFVDVADRFWEVRDLSQGIVDIVDEGLQRKPDAAPFANSDAYRDFIQEKIDVEVGNFSLIELEQEVANELNGVAKTESWDRYQGAIDTLTNLLPSTDAEPLAVAVAQDYVVETASWLERGLTCIDFVGEQLRVRDPRYIVKEVTFESRIRFVNPADGVFPVESDRAVGVVNEEGNPQVPLRFSIPETSYVEITMIDRNPEDWDFEEMRASQYALVGYSGDDPIDGDSSTNAPGHGTTYTLRVEAEENQINRLELRDLIARQEEGPVVLEICFQE